MSIKAGSFLKEQGPNDSSFCIGFHGQRRAGGRRLPAAFKVDLLICSNESAINLKSKSIL